MSTTTAGTEIQTDIQNVRSRRGTPTWEMAHLYPLQGQWTEEEYLRLGVARLIEFTDGVLEFLPMPTLSHQDIVKFLVDRLSEVVQARGAGRVYFAPSPVWINDGKYREPDVFFLKHERIKDRKKPPKGADLVIEVVSPGNEARERDLQKKRQEYAEAGIPEYWIVDPERRRITVLNLKEADQPYSVHGEFGPGRNASSVLLPEFEVSVDEVFAAGEDQEESDV